MSGDKTCGQCLKVFFKDGQKRLANHASRKFCSKSCAATHHWAVLRENYTHNFWAKVDKENSNGCWPWLGARRSKSVPYGQVKFEKKMMTAHRVAFILTYGAIESGKYILHSCDNPPCCNPAHLSEGTHADNMRDMTQKKRRPGLHRDINPSSKVTSAQAALIVAEHDSLPRSCARHVRKNELKKLSEKWKVSPSVIGDIVRNRHLLLRPKLCP